MHADAASGFREREQIDGSLPFLLAGGDDQIIDLEDLPPAVRADRESGLISNDGTALSTTALADLERITIQRVFEQAGGDKALAGKMLGISRATLYRKLKRYDIPLRSSEGKHLAQTAQ